MSDVDRPRSKLPPPARVELPAEIEASLRRITTASRRALRLAAVFAWGGKGDDEEVASEPEREENGKKAVSE